MNVHLVNFATYREDRFFLDLEPMQRRLIDSAKKFKVPNITSWNRARLVQTEFYNRHQNVLDQPRGAGYWLWKPYIILEKFKELNEGDFLFYIDADIKIIADPAPLLELCTQNNGILLFIEKDPRHNCKYWVKRDVFHLMDLDEPRYHNAPSANAGIQLYQKKETSQGFLEALLFWCTYNPGILTDEPNICGKPDLEGFIEHRHDQAILSMLRIKHDIEGFRIPTQYGDANKLEVYRKPSDWLPEGDYSKDVFENSPYDTLFYNGRENNRLKYWVKYKIPSLTRYYLRKLKKEPSGNVFD